MRSFYCYVRTTDNQFLSCAIAADSEANLCVMAYERFAEIGNPLPEPYMIRSMRFVADIRNEMDVVEYAAAREGRSPPDGRYAVASELTPDAPRH